MPRRGKCPPWGLWGGTAGEPGGYLMKLPRERDFTLMAGSHIPVPIGAQAIVRTGGGGGWGDPLERAPEQVAHDVAEGLVSAAVARRLYGVVLRGNVSLDETATRRLRDRLGSARKPGVKAKKASKKKNGNRSGRKTRRAR
jgi:N-methylhydantoinase B